jgi:cytochrome c
MKSLVLALAVAFAGAALIADAADDAATEALMKKSGCFKCHSVDKKKDGPSYKEVAAKYKGKPDAEQKLYTHLTSHPKVKIDGKEETHESLKTTDDAQVKDVVKWILAR